MPSLSQAWTLLLLASIFVFPQLLGVLLYFRLRRAPRWVATSIAILAPAIAFVLLAPLFPFSGPSGLHTKDETCGMPELGIILFLYAGTAVHLVLGLVTQAALVTWRRRKVSST